MACHWFTDPRTVLPRAVFTEHVAFDTQSNAVIDYRVDGEQSVESVRVEPQFEADSALGLDGSTGIVGTSPDAEPESGAS